MSRPVIGPVCPPGIHVMSWNIRRTMPAWLTRRPDHWRRRAPRVRALLSEERPAILCAQEMLGEQIAEVSGAFGPGYRWVGRGRSADGTGEACPIFYDRDRFDLLRWEQSALSDHPDRAGSRSWGNPFPRVLVSAVLRDRATSREFLMVNLHLDPLSARSRLRSARAVLDLLTAEGLPAVVAGDLNEGSGGVAVRELLAGDALVDSWDVASSRLTEPWGTYAGYREPRRGASRIDRIFTAPAVAVSSAAINPRRHGGGWPSDHLPVQAVLRPPASRQEEGARGS